MSYIAEKTGYSRQWLSKTAAQGKVPGAYRRRSGRWSFPDTPELHKWIAELGEGSAGWKARRAYRAEFAILDLRRRREKALARFGPMTQKLKQQIKELNSEILRAEGNLKAYLTCRDIADETGRSKRWVEEIAEKIPGVAVYKNRTVFRKSDALGQWLERERNAMHAEKRRQRTRPLWGSSQSQHLFWQTQRLRFFVDRILRHEPLNVWPTNFRNSMLTEFEGLHSVLAGHIEPWRKQIVPKGANSKDIYR